MSHAFFPFLLDPPLHHHARSTSASPTSVTSSSFVDTQQSSVTVQVTEASPETRRRGAKSSSLCSDLPVGPEDVRGLEGSLPLQFTKKAAGQMSPLASRKVHLSFARRRGHRKSSSLGSKYAHHSQRSQLSWWAEVSVYLGCTMSVCFLQCHSKHRKFTGKVPGTTVRSRGSWVLTVSLDQCLCLLLCACV